MWNPEDTHKVTEAIYKNITSNFNHGVRQILTAGKAYHKALVGMTSSAHGFIEAMGKVGYACQVNGQGGTDEIGGAILKLADIQKEMYAKVEECTKALFSEVILPLEHRLENDFKHAYAEHKKYQHGHKGYLSPYIKAQEALKKFRKKSKTRFTFDDSKEAQYVRAVAKFQEKLSDFRTQGLKLALLEERKCYCYLLERLTAMATVQSSYTKKGFELLATEIPYWKQLCSQPHILPRSVDPLITRREQRREQLENSQQNGMVYQGDHANYGSPYHRPVSNTEFMRQKSAPSEYAVPAMAIQSRTSKTLPRGMPSNTQNSQVPPLVTAIYAHVGRSDDQLSFNDGDMITLIGEKADGWQYGFNANTGKYGWFPLSYTDVVNISRVMDHPQLQRAKSIGDLLDSKSQISDINISYEIEMPGRSRRPRSLYESSMGKQANSTPQPHTPSPMSSQWSGHLYHNMGVGDPAFPIMGSDTSSAQASSGFHTLPRLAPQLDQGSQELYQAMPEPNYDAKMVASHHEAHTLPRHHDPYHTGQHQHMSLHHGSNQQMPPPPPPQTPPSLQAPQAPPPPPPINMINGLQQSWSGQPISGFPPPPPPTDYNIEDDEQLQRSQLFANVSLRKTQTNDRSAPRLK